MFAVLGAFAGALFTIFTAPLKASNCYAYPPGTFGKAIILAIGGGLVGGTLDAILAAIAG